MEKINIEAGSRLINPINILAGYEAINETPDGETQEEYDARMAKIRRNFGPHEAFIEENRRLIAIREAIASTALQVRV
jgi:hypothetical protein